MTKTQEKTMEWELEFQKELDDVDCEGALMAGTDWIIPRVKSLLASSQDSFRRKVEEMLEPYKILDNPEQMRKKHLYEGPTPLTEYALHSDLGYKKALEDVLAKLKTLNK